MWTFIYDVINKKINKAIITKYYKFRKIPRKIRNKISENFFNSTIKVLYEKSLKFYNYRRKFRGNSKKALEYLYNKENYEKEEKAIELLNLNGRAHYDLIIKDEDKVQKFIEMKQKDIKEDDEEYMKKKSKALYSLQYEPKAKKQKAK